MPASVTCARCEVGRLTQLMRPPAPLIFTTASGPGSVGGNQGQGWRSAQNADCGYPLPFTPLPLLPPPLLPPPLTPLLLDAGERHLPCAAHSLPRHSPAPCRAPRPSGP